MTTIADAIMAANIGGVTTIAKGVDVNSNSTAIFDDAIVTAQNADIVVLALGNDRSQVCAGQDPIVPMGSRTRNHCTHSRKMHAH